MAADDRRKVYRQDDSVGCGGLWRDTLDPFLKGVVSDFQEMDLILFLFKEKDVVL